MSDEPKSPYAGHYRPEYVKANRAKLRERENQAAKKPEERKRRRDRYRERRATDPDFRARQIQSGREKHYRVFQKMKKRTPQLKEYDDKVLLTMLEEYFDPQTSVDRKRDMEPLLVKYTSKPKPIDIDVSGEVNHTNLISNDAKMKLEQLLFEDPSVVATIVKDDESD